MMPSLLSPAQLLGYLALVFGVGCFLQTDDRRFKQFMAVECLAYVLHFWLLGQPTAVASSLVSLGRSVAAMYSRSRWLAALFVGLNLALGWWLFSGLVSLLPIAASCLGSLALFLLQGLQMRLLMLAGTLCWVVHNALVGSVGGTLLELVVAGVNGLTIWRLWRAGQAGR
ncbi:YgjV family protein [Paucibacter sp. XJ19-41]|uniref:YgjV family protein n=1 Tax=Paucibacter sp. XJ19-41 TaxID=2927824 RepID=UPI002349111D|nr:YgjV family protein [Paucibacter sp. XJ19-41]MDC6168477.1 YgjV family protein [Paucibacter sp. XJ19-41]